jgi:hypothetical protein
VIVHGPAFLIPFMLGKHAAQVSLAGFSAAILLLALASYQFFFAHPHPGAIAAHVENRCAAGFGRCLTLLPPLRAWPDRLHQSLELSGRDVDAVGFFKMFLGLFEALFVNAFQTHQPNQSRGVSGFQSQRVFTDKSLLIDTSKLTAEEVSGIILVEVFWHAQHLMVDLGETEKDQAD